MRDSTTTKNASTPVKIPDPVEEHDAMLQRSRNFVVCGISTMVRGSHAHSR
jgi:hypothetical protein